MLLNPIGNLRCRGRPVQARDSCRRALRRPPRHPPPRHQHRPSSCSRSRRWKSRRSWRPCGPKTATVRKSSRCLVSPFGPCAINCRSTERVATFPTSNRPALPAPTSYFRRPERLPLSFRFRLRLERSGVTRAPRRKNLAGFGPLPARTAPRFFEGSAGSVVWVGGIAGILLEL